MCSYHGVLDVRLNISQHCHDRVYEFQLTNCHGGESGDDFFVVLVVVVVFLVII